MPLPLLAPTNTSATTTASTNSSTNATTTESTNASATRRTPIKMAMLRIIDSIQSPTLTKSRIWKRESNGFVREKETEKKAQFPNTSRI
ncbi:BEM_collapsed_G0035760.mRNA.1.CDS.1 [Saccharomyces cerevisiae]|nr:BEM_collapsed_G0035760.mRNA.1.CDS.1 [Saccharomyces cerevisiae]